jgi:hypothetical protein
MLPIGSVGMVISKPRKDSDARQALPLLTIISHAPRRLRTRLRVVEKVGEGMVEQRGGHQKLAPKVCSGRRSE